MEWLCFNPLLRGAAFATETAPDRPDRVFSMFQSPTSRGGLCNWGESTTARASSNTCFNPLLRGAAFATQTKASESSSDDTSFNPLLRGAAFATRRWSSMVV